MKQFSLPYGQSTVNIEMPAAGYLGSFLPNKTAFEGSAADLLWDALQHPIGSPPLKDLVKPEQKVVIVTSDLTRPCPNAIILPPLIQALNDAGVPDDNISIVIALGLHRKMTPEELQKSVGDDLLRRIRVLNHDIEDVVLVGETSRGTPVEIFRPVVEADIRICVGNVEFHYFAGYSGGAKAIMPGVASERAVKANHSHMVKEAASPGNLLGNPVREDLEEAVDMIGVDFILNVIVDEKQNIVHASAGHVYEAHRELCNRLVKEGMVTIPQQMDLAIVSAGGYPKDIDLYQAQKALDNIISAVKPGGVVILLAECSEGYGNKTFAQWMASKTADEALNDLKENFVLGGHKAAAIAKVAKMMHVFLVTTEGLFPGEMVGITAVDSWEEAWQKASKILGESYSYGVFPLGASTLPTLAK